MTYAPRRRTPTALIGGVPVGSAHPVVVQSMTNTDTADIAGTVHQVAALARAGSGLRSLHAVSELYTPDSAVVPNACPVPPICLRFPCMRAFA